MFFFYFFVSREILQLFNSLQNFFKMTQIILEMLYLGPDPFKTDTDP
jgi:hypothetical protein